MSSTASPSRVFLVTGANRGIGYGIARRLAVQTAATASSGGGPPSTIYLTSRDLQRGQQALEALRSELKGQDVLQGDGAGTSQLDVLELDVTSAQSRRDMIAELQRRQGAQHAVLDVLVNNSGIALDGFNGDVVTKTFGTNYYAVKDLVEDVKKSGILKRDSRIVVLASMAGRLDGYKPELAKRFREAKTVKEADAIATDFKQAVDAGKEKEQGFKSAAYATSKACIIAWTRAIANEWAAEKATTTINCCCPGYVNTDMTKGRGALTLDQGARTPVLLALADEVKGRSGEYWANQKMERW
ncbi:carbonyl reductase-like protein [Acaromyces ingoldii]|uniref:Carbonyl reductase-like protein n=1 Tax=Acaromyces ingoldii TaxID=215250 RepID=A0A316YMJ5_9BASI|nr:carbonyl reductase-like protein [Acaromyces ingoldii]PWN89888.1 carbonyl reductase-like protein [Acaromyces ingoldii]